MVNDTWIKKCVAFENITMTELSDEIELIDCGTSQETYASQFDRITKDGELPAKYNALVFYRVDPKVLKYNKTKVEPPKF